MLLNLNYYEFCTSRHSGLSRIRSDSGVVAIAPPKNDNYPILNAIAFGIGARSSEFHVGDAVDIVYTIDEDRWNGNRKLQLKIKDIKPCQ